MAKNLLNVDGGQIVSYTNGRLYIIKPAATPSGWQDYYIEVSDLLSVLNGLISTNSSNITLNNNRLSTLEDLTKKTRTASTGTFTFPMPADSELSVIVFVKKTGTPEVKAGLSAGDSSLVYAHTVSTRTTFALFYPFDSGATVHITVTGGTIDCIFYSKENVNT